MTKKREQERRLIDIRRASIMNLLSKGHTNQAEIAKTLNISEPTVSRDISFLKEKSRQDLSTHLSHELPWVFSKGMTGINEILRRAHEILDSTKDLKLQKEYMTLIMQLWGTLMNMATDGGVIERTFKKVEQLQSSSDSSSEGQPKEEFPKEDDRGEPEQPEPEEETGEQVEE